MEWKIFASTFLAIFMAEFADKSQLVGMTLSAESGKPVPVFFASVLAYACVTVLTVTLGAGLSKILSPDLLRLIGGGVFIVLGILIVSGKF